MIMNLFPQIMWKLEKEDILSTARLSSGRLIMNLFPQISEVIAEGRLLAYYHIKQCQNDYEHISADNEDNYREKIS